MTRLTDTELANELDARLRRLSYNGTAAEAKAKHLMAELVSWLGGTGVPAAGVTPALLCRRCGGQGVIPCGDGYSVNPCPYCNVSKKPDSVDTSADRVDAVDMTDERKEFEAAMRETWAMVDPLRPPGAPGSYARGHHNGVICALQTLRDNLDRQSPSLLARQGRDWRPIETAPRDGEIVLLASIGRDHVMVREGRWDYEAGRWSWPWICDRAPLYWMPVPDAPAGALRGDGGRSDG